MRKRRKSACTHGLLHLPGSANHDSWTFIGAGKQALHKACRTLEGRPVAALLLGSSADIEARDSLGHTPLYCACARGANDIAEMLVQHGADKSAASEFSEKYPFLQ